MENNVEAVDDQGSGWFEVKKKHRSSTKFSVRSWAGGFSGKTGSYHLNQLSLSGKGGNSHRKHGYQLPKRSSKPSTHGGGNIPSSSTVLNEDENLRHRLDDRIDKQDNKGGEISTSLHSPKGGDTQILLLKDNTDVVPKIKWGDLEDDVLVLHHEKHSGSDVNLANQGTNNLEAGEPGNNSPLLSDVSSGTSLQEIKMVATAANVDAFPDGISSLSNTDDLIEESHTDMIAVSSLDSEVQSVNSKINTPIDGSNCMEIINEHSITTDDEFHPTSPSCKEAGTEVKLQGCDIASEVNQSTISDVSLTNRSSVRMSHDSESIAPQSIGPKLSGDAGIVVKPQVPLISPVDESEVSKLPDTNGRVGTAVIPAVIPLELDKKSYLCETAEPEISKDAGMMVKLQLPVISEVNESEMSDVPVAIESSSEKIIAQDSKSLVSEKNASEVSIEGTLVDGKMHDELSKFRSMSALGQGEAGESKERFRERLWCFLFENLNRAVDELYLLCELECDIEQMKEAVLVLEEAASDFKELTTRVQEFENVKRSSSHLVDGAPITLKSDHRRPHALSWEVRRMTTSPHRAEILSSSLEAFKRIQQERAQMLAANNAKSLGLECSNHHHVSGESDLTATVTGSMRKLCPGNLDDERRNAEQGRSNKVTFVQNGLDPPFNVPISDVNSSKLPVRDSSATLGPGKSKREPEVEKLLHKREKTLLESTMDKNVKSSDHLKKQILLSDKEKEKRNSAPWKSMDAWKEKRNWEAILSSPFRVSSRISHSPGMSRKSAERARILHDKLMTPEKKKKTALDLKKEAEEKHARAMRIRSELENERVQKLQRTSEKLNRVNVWQAERTMKLREGMYARHQRSESRHEAYLAQVARRAGDESSKVNEVRFITSLNEENKKLMLRQKLQDSELRRAEKLQVIKTKQKEDLAREEAVLERRKLIEAEKLQRLAEMQRKKEEAQIRREEERKASSAAREARTIEQLRRREERAKAQQEEAEMLAQKLAERLRESEQRRKYYLEQIRERASMDFRDQSSPLLRRSTNKEGQGRSTPPNCSEDYQEDGAAGTGGSALIIGNGTVQHSLKRRIKKIRQRLMALKFEFSEPPPENAGIGYRTAVGRAKFGRWIQELQRLRQARKEGAASIGLLTAEMIKYMEGKDPELQAARQAGLLDFIASALPASHASKPEACQVTIHLLKLLRVVLYAPVNRSYFLAQNLLPPIIPMLSAALENYIKIAASLNVPGSTNSSSSKASVESFESTSEILDNCIWTVATVIGHPGSDEREIQMRDGLLELLVAYQVIHRLRDLFALYDRPQVEGSPFPLSIPLSIHLLVILTYRPRTNWSIDWESSPMETMVGFDRVEGNLLQIDNCSFPSPNITSSENYAPPLSALNGCTLVPPPNVSDERPLGEPYDTNKSESISLGKDAEKKPSTPVELDNANANIGNNLDDSKKGVIDEKNKNNLVITGAVKQRDEQLSTKQPIAFLLSAISETGLVSLPSLLTAVLLQANNKLSSEQGSYILPSNFEEVATGVLKVFNNLALLDITFMQRMLARPDLKMEFFHLMSFLLSHCTSKWKGATDQIGLLLLESLLLLGYFALFHSENQAVLRWGKGPTILHKVCDLPFVFFSDPELMPVLAGTLVAACYGCEQNMSVVQQELSMDMLLSLLRSCRTVQPPVLSHPALENLPGEDILETNQQVSDVKKPQGDVPQKSNRYNGKNSRAFSLGKGGAASSSSRIGKMRSQRDSKATKTIEEMASKHNLLVPEASVMLHYRFPGSFLDRAERYFSAGMVNMGAAV